MMSVMFEQTEEISKERPVTAEDMSNIVMNYLAQSGLDEKEQKLLKKLCLHFRLPKYPSILPHIHL